MSVQHIAPMNLTTAEWREVVKDQPQRVGCLSCDDVFALEGRRLTEEELHDTCCPHCGDDGGLHEYPVRGTWPSDYGDRCPFEHAP